MLTMAEAREKQLYSYVTRSRTKKTLGNLDYIEDAEFAHGRLPTKKEIIQNMLYLLRPKRAGQAQRTTEDAASLLANVLEEHWFFCNIYTVTQKWIKAKILELYKQFTTLIQTRMHRRNENYFQRLTDFNQQSACLFDVFCNYDILRKKLEDSFGVKMTEVEWKFYEDQKKERKMYCEDFVDRKWTKSMERRQRDLQAMENLRNEAERQKQLMKSVEFVPSNEEQSSDEGDTSLESIDRDIPEPSSPLADSQCDTKKRRISSDILPDASDDMPFHYRHIREGVRKVRPEYYETIDRLKSCFHMSTTQAEAAVVVVGNKMFGRSWKHHSDGGTIDFDTLPHSKNARLVGQSIEVMALHEIVKEIIASEEQVTITYSDDGSRKQGTGSFSVQGIHISGIYRALPTMPLSSETRQNLASLKLAVLSLLEAASDVPSKQLFEKIDFVMTDQTAHNFDVDVIVSEQLETDHIPEHLFCNVHPTLMFNRIITKQWSEIENKIGRDKIYSNFLVDVTTSASSVTEQALDCLTHLINHDFDHKPWNKSSEFNIHISPKKNKSVSLKDERFNRLPLTCAVSLYHLEDISSFLQKYENVTNQLACIVRCFLELDFLKVMYCTGALIGIHLVEPFLSLTTSTSTSYSTLIPAFQQLYVDLDTVDPTRLLNLTVPAFSFVSVDRFNSVKYDDDICVVICQVCNQFTDQILKMLRKLLPDIASGFQKQKGNIFGFGDFEDDAPHALSRMSMSKLDKAPIHNLDAERSVGFINYELSRRGACHLSAASSSQVKCKSVDLLERRHTGSFKAYSSLVKKGGKIPEILGAWQAKQQMLKSKGLQDKEIANVAVDKRKHKDLAALKDMGGPFTSVDDLEKFILETVDKEMALKRLYLEVRYARDTSLSIPKSRDIFRLMHAHKKLPLATYTANLKTYLSNVSSKADATFEDFQKALDEI